MVHKYTLFGYNIAIDVESGAVHILSDIAYKMLDYIDLMLKQNDTLPKDCPVDIRYQLAKYDSVEISEAYAEIIELHENNMLFSKPVDIKLDAPEITPIKAMCLHISHECNMACKYCFAGKGDFGIDKGEKYMSEETGIKAIDFLLENSLGRRNLEVDFFGGEPLLNFNTVKNIVEKTRKSEKEKNKNVRFTLTTNGTLLDDEKIAYINKHMSNIVLSLDGLQTTNDNMRTYGNNGESGVYSEVVPLYKKLVENRDGKDYYIRGTFTRHNLDFAKDAIHIAELGFSNVSIEPVVAEEKADYSIRKQDLPAVFHEYEFLAREIIRRKRKGEDSLNFFHFIIDLDSGPCVYKRAKGCGAGSEYIAVTPDGDIYPCHQFVGNLDYKLGNVNAKDKLNKELMSEFAGNNIINNNHCKDCWVKYFCGGGCAANNAKFNKNIYAPYEISCEMEKKRVECAIAIKIATE